MNETLTLNGFVWFGLATKIWIVCCTCAPLHAHSIPPVYLMIVIIDVADKCQSFPNVFALSVSLSLGFLNPRINMHSIVCIRKCHERMCDFIHPYLACANVIQFCIFKHWKISNGKNVEQLLEIQTTSILYIQHRNELKTAAVRRHTTLLYATHFSLFAFFRFSFCVRGASSQF